MGGTKLKKDTIEEKENRKIRKSQSCKRKKNDDN